MKSKSFSRIIKVLFDYVFSVFVLIALMPLLALISLLVKFDGTNGPVFALTPVRVGKDEKPFFMFKFRTMVPDAHDLVKSDPKFKKTKSLKLQNGGKVRTEDDERVTWIGKILRRWDLDELPQFVNVLRGEMSVIGPRPHYVEEVQECKDRYPDLMEDVKSWLSVKPGITGLWQVSGRNDLSLEQRIKLNGRYVREYSLLTDFKILIKTPLVIIFRIGSW